MSGERGAVHLGMGSSIECSAVILDVDGTLVDSTPAVERVWRTWSAEYGIDAETVLHGAHGRRSEDTIRELLEQEQVERALRRQQVLELEDLGDVRALPGALGLVTQLAAHPTLRWALATSLNSRLLSARMAAAALPMPATVVTSELVVNGKPDPECYLLAGRELGVPLQECVVVEDSPSGVIAAKAAGATVIAVTHTFPAERLAAPADFVITSLYALRVTEHGLSVDRE
jgi:mannitol-1-/sugar-/sorbitol-6-phosphatase